MDKKSIIVYYSWAGHTKAMANIIQQLTGADLLEIQPKNPYSKNYNECVNLAKKEIREGYLPPIQNIACDFIKYDVVFVGTPIWWGTMAPPLATFLHENKLDGKTIMPFTTHGGGGKGHSDKDLERLCPGSMVISMYTTYEGGGRNAETEIETWLRQNNQI